MNILEKLMQVQSIFPHPVLNTPQFLEIYGGKDGSTLKTGKEKIHVREVEFFAFQGMIFQVTNKISKEDFFIYEVITDIYPSNKNLYIDSRFVKTIQQTNSKEKKIFPAQVPQKTILERLKKMIGMPYLWGGNLENGAERFFQLYPPKERIDEETKRKWQGKGVDCSGLIFFASRMVFNDGREVPLIPRNTSAMIDPSFGKVIEIEGLSFTEIIKKVKPLDLILHIGHVIIILNNEKTIESREFQGVVVTSLQKRLQELQEKGKKPKNNISQCSFIVKRWYEDIFFLK